MGHGSTFSFFVLLFLFQSLAHGAKRYEFYGDSITAGLLSGHSVAPEPPLSEVSDVMSDFAKYLITHDAKLIEKHHRRDLAWPAWLVKELDGSKGPSNFAVSGDRTVDLVSQLDVAQAAYTDLIEDSMAFFFVGHNDLCKSSDDLQAVASIFQRQYRVALEKWDAKHKKSTAVLLPIADVPQVYEVLRGFVWHHGQANYQCEDSWKKFFPYCRDFAKKAEQGTLRKELGPKIEKMNQYLANLVDQKAFQIKIENENKYVYLDNFFNESFKPDYFSFDCYHLSATGQKRIADKILEKVKNPLLFASSK